MEGNLGFQNDPSPKFPSQMSYPAPHKTRIQFCTTRLEYSSVPQTTRIQFRATHDQNSSVPHTTRIHFPATHDQNSSLPHMTRIVPCHTRLDQFPATHDQNTVPCHTRLEQFPATHDQNSSLPPTTRIFIIVVPYHTQLEYLSLQYVPHTTRIFIIAVPYNVIFIFRHRWLHYIGDETPIDSPPTRRDWMIDHKENLTGTAKEYVAYSTTKPKVHAWIPPKN